MKDRMTAAEFAAQHGGGRQIIAGIVAGRTPDPKPQIRIPVQATPNKTERALMDYAERIWPDCKIAYETITLRLPSGTKYTPDVIVTRGNAIIAILEGKGPHIHNQRSIHAFKEALAAFPQFKFYFCQLTKAGWAVSPKFDFDKDGKAQ